MWSSGGSHVIPSRVVLSAQSKPFQDLGPFLEKPPSGGAEEFRDEGTTEDGRPIADCSRSSILGLAVDFTDDSSLGRYAFAVFIRNSLSTPMRNTWMLSSYSQGQLLEQGAAGGYEVTNLTVSLPLQEERSRLPVPARSLQPSAPNLAIRISACIL